MSVYSEDLTHNEVVEYLRQWRESGERKSEEIVRLSICGNLDMSKLGNEQYLIQEQMIFADLDCHSYPSACFHIKLLSEEFPGSLRVMRYNAMLFEAKEKYTEALEILDHIIKVDETNSAARKRRVAIMKAQGQINEAIKELVDYLKKFMSDVEAWQELSELYLQVGEYSRAVFCAEEMLLHQPHNHLLQQRVADIRYTMGGVENLELAKTYYCQTLKLNPNNMRALLGLILTTNSLLTHYKASGNSASSKRKEVWRICQWAQSQASRRHQKDADVTQMMLALAITD